MNSSLTVPSSSSSTMMAKKQQSSVLSPAPSLLSLRSVIDFMPNEIRTRYKDTARYRIWPECPLDPNGNAVDISDADQSDGRSFLIGGGSKLKRNATAASTNALTAREYSKFGNVPVLIEPKSFGGGSSAAFPKFGRPRRTSESAGYHQSSSFSPFRSRKPAEATTTVVGRQVAYFSSKDAGVRFNAGEMTRL